jgi:hypothetical protein
MNPETKIALVCPVVFRESLLRAIRKNGFSFHDYSYSTLPGNKVFRKVVGKIRILFELFSFISYNKKLEKLLISRKTQDYDHILIIHGHFLSRKNKLLLDRMNLHNIVLWTTDSLVRHKSQKGIVPYCRQIYFHDGNDPVKDNEIWLPFGYDDEIFRMNAIQKEIDVLFVGNIYPKVYRKRLRYLKTLCKSSLVRKYKCVYAGQVSGIINNIKFSLFCKGINRIGRIDSQKLSDTINTSRICINIQQDDGLLTVNPMFFAIPACGSCMLAEDLEYFSKWLTPNRDFIPIRESSFTQIINYMLEDKLKIEFISSTAHGPASKNSMANCIKLIVQDSIKFNG